MVVYFNEGGGAINSPSGPWDGVRKLAQGVLGLQGAEILKQGAERRHEPPAPVPIDPSTHRLLLASAIFGSGCHRVTQVTPRGRRRFDT